MATLVLEILKMFPSLHQVSQYSLHTSFNTPYLILIFCSLFLSDDLLKTCGLELPLRKLFKTQPLCWTNLFHIGSNLKWCAIIRWDPYLSPAIKKRETSFYYFQYDLLGDLTDLILHNVLKSHLEGIKALPDAQVLSILDILERVMKPSVEKSSLVS